MLIQRIKKRSKLFTHDFSLVISKKNLVQIIYQFILIMKKLEKSHRVYIHLGLKKILLLVLLKKERNPLMDHISLKKIILNLRLMFVTCPF